MNELIFNGKNFTEFNAYYATSNFLDGAAKDVQSVSVVGRSGDLQLSNNRYKNLSLKIRVYVTRDMEASMRAMRNYLESVHGYARVEISDQPNEFRMAAYKEMFAPDSYDSKAGVVDLTFDSMPQRFLKSGETTTSVSSSSSEISGNPVSIDNPSGLTSLTGLSVDIEPVQSGEGDPSPTNIRPITGHTSATVQRTGKNLLSSDTYQTNANTLSLGTSDGNGKTFLFANTEYTFSCTVNKTASLYYIGASQQSGTRVGTLAEGENSLTFSVPSDGNYRIYVYASGGFTTSNIDSFMLETGNTATTYEAPQIQTVTIDLNGTVYGGTLDVLTGVLTVTHKFTELNGDSSISYSAGRLYANGFNDFVRLMGYTTDDIISDKLPTVADYSRVTDNGLGITGYVNATQYPNQNWIYFGTGDPSITTPAQMKAWLAENPLTVVYKLATPQTVQLTAQQVSLLTGTNIISTDMNSLTVTIASPAELENPTLFESKPLIRVYGNGTLNVNDIYITVANSPYTYIDIDCELMDCYHGSNNANQYVSFSTTDYVTLRSGTNYFSYSGFTQVEVTPRWFEV